jgi:dienelactone hydrolase
MNSESNADTLVRAFFRAVLVPSAPPPYDVAHLKVYYPAKLSGSDIERNQGVVPPDAGLAPFPVVVFFSGGNCSAHQYGWLASDLARVGYAVVTFDYMQEFAPDRVGLTPGFDPVPYPAHPTSMVLPAILNELKWLQENSVLKGTLDLDRIALGGHSAGGSVALLNAETRWFPGVVAAFAYGSNPLRFVSSAKLATDCPLLLIGASEDGILAELNERYGNKGEHPINTLRRVFDEAMQPSLYRQYYAVIGGANHFSIAYPRDYAIGRIYADDAATQSDDLLRDAIITLIRTFLDEHVRGTEDVGAIEALIDGSHPVITGMGR